MTAPLTDALNALISYSNSVTGASDTTISECVETLVAGYSGGSSASLTYTPSVNTPLTTAIESLITYANTVTGASDTTLSDCIATLCAGYNPGTSWDYEWYATSGTLPTGATSGTPTFVDDYMSATNLNFLLSDISKTGFEIQAVIKHNGNATSSSPQICIKTSTKYGVKLYLNTSKNTTVAGMTASKSITADNTFHEYRVKYDNGTFTAYFDGEQIASGTGRYNNNSDKTGVFGSSATFSYKSICYREWN